MKMRNMPQQDGNTAKFSEILSNWILVLGLERLMQ